MEICFDLIVTLLISVPEVLTDQVRLLLLFVLLAAGRIPCDGIVSFGFILFAFHLFRMLYITRKSITYNYMLYKGVVVSKIDNHYSIIYLGLTN